MCLVLPSALHPSPNIGLPQSSKQPVLFFKYYVLEPGIKHCVTFLGVIDEIRPFRLRSRTQF